MSSISVGRSAPLTIAWGVFAACSWTWCIGMFLPKLMVERHGAAGFLVFAVPNVLGCVGFGYVLGRPARSEAMVARHGAAMAAFSVVAVAFHMFFVAFLFERFVLPPDAAAWLPLAAAATVFVLGRMLAEIGDGPWLLAAALVYALSLVAFAATGLGAWPELREAGDPDPAGLAWFSGVVVLGFLLCPYLDLTFHRTLQRAPSRHAFAVFALAFTVMIVFTCFLWFGAPRPLLGLGLAHLAGQSVFTVGAHLRELAESRAIAARDRRRELMLLPLAAAPLLLFGRLVSDAPELGSDLYLRFLVFYGLVFPAYVLVFVGPWRAAPLSRPALVRFALVVLLLAPLYEIGFLHGRPQLLTVPVALVVVWAVARRRR